MAEVILHRRTSPERSKQAHSSPADVVVYTVMDALSADARAVKYTYGGALGLLYAY